MRRFKGTKGNWELEQDGNSAFFINSTERKEIVSVWIEDDESEEEAEANAKLIAAAPKLLEALLYYFDVLEEVRGKDFKDKPDHVLSKMINAVNNALS